MVYKRGDLKVQCWQVLMILGLVICSGCSQKTDNKTIRELTKTIQKEPANAEAYNKRGVMYYEQGKLERAVLDYNKAIEIDSKFAKAYNNRGLFYYKKGKLEQAITDYNKAIEIKPDFAAAYNNRAVVYFFKEDYVKSWEDLHKAEALGYSAHPDFLEALKRASGRQK